MVIEVTPTFFIMQIHDLFLESFFHFTLYFSDKKKGNDIFFQLIFLFFCTANFILLEKVTLASEDEKKFDKSGANNQCHWFCGNILDKCTQSLSFTA
jgi:hypothetical protein